MPVHLRGGPYGPRNPNGGIGLDSPNWSGVLKQINKIEKIKNVEKDNLNFNLVSRTPSAVPGYGLGDARSIGHFLEENRNFPKFGKS